MITSKYQTALPGPALPQFQCETQTLWVTFLGGGEKYLCLSQPLLPSKAVERNML